MGNIPNYPWALGILLAFVVAIALDLGFRVGVHYQVQQDSSRKEEMNSARDGFFVLVSLLLGFTLALAASRYVERRSLLVDEAASVGTAFRRAGTLPEPYRDQSQTLFRNYVDARLDLGNAGLDPARSADASNRSEHILKELWNAATAAAQSDPSALTLAYVNSLNETIGLHDKRTAASENRTPRMIWLLIIFVSVIAAFTRGLTLTSRFWLNLVLLPVILAIVVALIADLDTPRHGLIRTDQRALQRLKATLCVEAPN